MLTQLDAWFKQTQIVWQIFFFFANFKSLQIFFFLNLFVEFKNYLQSQISHIPKLLKMAQISHIPKLLKMAQIEKKNMHRKYFATVVQKMWKSGWKNWK